MNIAMSILLALILLSNLLLFGLFFIVIQRIRSFIVSPGEQKPSPLSLSLQALSDMVGRSIVATLKATFMGKQSGLVRGEQAVSGDIAQDQLAQSPIGAVLQSFPTLGKSLRRNPALLDLALSAFSGMNRNQSGVITQGNGEKPKFKFGA